MPQACRTVPKLAPDCTGCGSCANICPVNAIDLRINKDGFYAPEINASACLKCQTCVRSCPQLMPNVSALRQKQYPTSVPYGAWALDDDVRKASSSGGVFTVLARRVLALGGSVYGAAWDTSGGGTPHLCHIRMTRAEELCRLQGSKYIQSEIGFIYREVKEDLKKGVLVLFSGTPCQAAALRSYLKKAWDNLIVLDVACHGVPSRLLFEAYVREQGALCGEQIVRVDFRNKSHGWSPYCVVNHFHSGGNSAPQLSNKNDFMNGFIADIAMNRACHSCRWATQPRVADITLADFWCLHLVHPRPAKEWTDNKGISLVLANSPKGTKLLHSCSQELFLHQETWEAVRNTNAGIFRRPHFISALLRLQVLTKLASGRRLSEILQAYVHQRQAKYDIGILNMEQGDVCGSTAVSYALYKSFETMGFSTALLAPKERSRTADTSPPLAQQFQEREEMAVVHTSRDQAYKLNERFRGFVVIGNTSGKHQTIDTFTLLDFTRGDKRRIALNFSATAVRKLRWRAARLKGRFDAISLVDASGEVTPMPEPIFWLSRQLWEQLKHSAESHPHITACIVAPSSHNEQLLTDIGTRWALPVEHIGNGMDDFDHWLNSIAGCELLVTDSVITLCMAVIFNKPFICLSMGHADTERVKSLLQILGLENCLTPAHADILAHAEHENINWEQINERTRHWRTAAHQCTKQAMLAPRPEALERYIAQTESYVVRKPSRILLLKKRLYAKASQILHRFWN